MLSNSVAILVGIACLKGLVVSAEEEHKPTVAMSLLFLVIPAVIGLSAVSVLARKVYVACSKKDQPDSPAIREMGEEFSTSLDTTDSFDELRFETIPDHTPVSVMWNPFQKSYANIETKLDMPDPLEEMEARFVLRKQNKVCHVDKFTSTTTTKQ